ncbi:glycoside hydrolase family 26 protein [Modestobacter sp. SYSU DS0657]
MSGGAEGGSSPVEHATLERASRPADEAGTRKRTGRRTLLLGLALLLVVALVVIGSLVGGEDDEPLPTQSPDTTSSAPPEWLSGASGVGVATGEFGAWRGTPVEIAGTWADDEDAMVRLDQLRSGAEYGDWDKPIDIALGGVFEGETWDEAAAGVYDERWRESLTELARLRADRPGTTYIRFAHEMNGDWYPWAVRADDVEAFIEAWKRFRGLQEEIFPDAQLVFAVNRESVDNGVDWRLTFPGTDYVDVLGVDYYNQNDYVDTAAEWSASLEATAEDGSPEGLARHLEFARSVGLPLAVPEWSGVADEGDSPAFIRGMFEFFREHAGTRPGELLYEIQFNVDQNDSRFQLYGAGSRMPESSEAYQQSW